MLNSIKENILYRTRALAFCVRGRISVFQLLCQMVPRSMRPANNAAVSLFGKSFTVPARDLGDFILLIHQIVDKNQYHTELIGDNAVVVDGGANVGVFSIAVAEAHADAIIYAFEPTPETFRILQDNINAYSNIRAFNCGLGDKQTTASVIDLGHGGGGNYIGEVGEGIPVKIKTIDSLNIPMTFLKMDTEGYEANILRGATATIRKYKPIISMSAYHKPNDKTELPKLLNSMAPYDCELRSDCEEDFICKPSYDKSARTSTTT